jgi:hypothetical protein
MASGDGMRAWSFRSALVVALTPGLLAAEVPMRDRQDITRLAESRGVASADLAPLLADIDRAASRGLPQEALVNKLKEGLAKGVPPVRVHAVLRDIVGHMDRASGLLGPVADAALRARAIEVLAEALGRGVTPDDVTRLARLAQGSTPATAESLAFGAKGWALLREAGITSDDGVPLMAEAMRQGFRSADILSLAREVSRRRDDFTSGRMTLESVREAVRRGERPERVLPPERPERPERVAPERPETPERPERPPEPPSERPERPERPPR